MAKNKSYIVHSALAMVELVILVLPTFAGAAQIIKVVEAEEEEAAQVWPKTENCCCQLIENALQNLS